MRNKISQQTSSKNWPITAQENFSAKMSDLTVTFLGESAAKLVKWKVKKGGQVGRGSLMCLYKSSGSEDIQKLKSNDVGTVQELCIEEGDQILPG